MKNRLGFILLALFAIFALAVPTFAQDEDEPLLTLNLLEDGESFDDVLTEDSTTRLYAFNAFEGDEVTISMEQNSDELDPYLILLGPAGELITHDDDSGDVALSSLIEEIELPLTGTYFIIASSFSLVRGFEWTYEEDELEFEFSIEGITSPDKDNDEGDEGFLYYSGDLVDGETIGGYSDANEVVYYWTFFGEEGQEVDIELESDDFDTLLYLFAPGGYRIAGNDDDNGTNSAIEGIELPEDGIYLVFATDYWFTDANTSDGNFNGGDFDISLDISGSGK